MTCSDVFDTFMSSTTLAVSTAGSHPLFNKFAIIIVRACSERLTGLLILTQENMLPLAYQCRGRLPATTSG